MAIVPHAPGCTMERVPSSPSVIRLGDAERGELESPSRPATARGGEIMHPYVSTLLGQTAVLGLADPLNCRLWLTSRPVERTRRGGAPAIRIRIATAIAAAWARAVGTRVRVLPVRVAGGGG